MSEETTEDAPLSPTVRALGVVSLCTDLSSEMVYPINPIFLTKVLGAPYEAVGLIEGVAESTASLLKLYSGWLSDRQGRRKPLTLLGYSLAALAKPMIGYASLWPTVFLARLLDRTGKGLRAAPRDALIADSSTPTQRGRAYGLHRSMDTIGAVLGPLVGWYWLQRYPLTQYPTSLRGLYFLAFFPALLGVLVLIFFVREGRQNPAADASAPPPLSFSALSPAYRRYLGIVLLFGLGNSSDAFLLLRARDLGVTESGLLLLYALFNTIEAALGYAAGKLSDRLGRRPLIATGWGVFALVYLGFALATSPVAVWILFPLYGIYYTLTQGAQKALAADLVPPAQRGAQIGAFHLLAGIAALPASLLAGFLYHQVAPSAPFAVGAVTAALSAILLLRPAKRRK